MITGKRRIRCAAPRRRQSVVTRYLEAKEKYEEAAKRAQIKSWKEFCCTQDRESLWDGIYRVIRRTSTTYEDQPLVNNGVLLSTKDSTKLLATTFFPLDLETDDNPEQTEVRNKSKNTDKLMQNDKQDPFFTKEELVYVTNAFNPKKAPGPDGLTADICSEAILSNTEVFLAMINKCLELHHFPVSWKKAIIVVLRKPGKSDYNHVKSYRPIGLLSIFGKILEKLMIRRVRWHLLPKANPRQYGFVPQRSTEDSLYDLVQHIKNNLVNKLINVVVSLDIEGAFDSAWWPAIKCRLAEKGCPQNIRRLVTSYLENRRVRVRYADHEHDIITSKGCVQGSIGGPTFWNELLDPLLDGIVQRGAYCQAFADDVVLVFSGHSVRKIEEEADRVLSYVYAWGVQNKLKFAPHKTSAMVITKKLKFDTPRIRMADAPIDLVEEIKILGLIIDNKLTFNSHVKYVCTKALNIYKPLSRSAKINWGLSSEIIRTIYVSVIEPIVLYAASTWAPAAEKLTVQKHLNAVQRGFAQKITKSYRTVSLPAALTLARLIPLDLRVQEAAQLFSAKRGKPQEMIGGRVVETKRCFLDSPHPAHQHEIGFVKLSDKSDLSNGENSFEEIQIFTDGSKIGGKVGAALTCWRNGSEIGNKKFTLEPFCTVYQAELYAIYRATEVAAKLKDKIINIYSDSRSSLETIKNIDNYHPLAFEIRQNLIKLKTTQKEVRMFWIKAHAGVEGNERADQLAKEAALTKKTAPDYSLCPASYIKRTIRIGSINNWQERYSNSEKALVTKMFFPRVEEANSVLRKIELTPLLVQVFTGHGGFKQYLHRFKLRDSPACECEPNVEQSVEHILTSCPMFSRKRYDLAQKLDIKIEKETIHKIIQHKILRDIFLKFCESLAKHVVKSNKDINQIISD